MRRAVSPAIAAVILVAVTVAIAVAVASWLMGLWSSYGEVEQLVVMPDTSISNATLTLHVANRGSRPVAVTRVVVVGLGAVNTSIAVPIGGEADQQLSLPAAATPGSQYLVEIYTDTGSVYQAVITAR